MLGCAFSRRSRRISLALFLMKNRRQFLQLGAAWITGGVLPTWRSVAVDSVPGATAKESPHPMKPDEKTAAICGLFCGTCPFYPHDCHGCLSDKLTAHCMECPNGFRDCAQSHKVTRCYECPEFPCDRLKAFSKTHVVNGVGHHENVIKDLADMKQQGVKVWVAQKTKENTCLKCSGLIPWFNKKSHACK